MTIFRTVETLVSCELKGGTGGDVYNVYHLPLSCAALCLLSVTLLVYETIPQLQYCAVPELYKAVYSQVRCCREAGQSSHKPAARNQYSGHGTNFLPCELSHTAPGTFSDSQATETSRVSRVEHLIPSLPKPRDVSTCACIWTHV